MAASARETVMYLDHFGLQQAPFPHHAAHRVLLCRCQPRRDARSADLRDHPRRRASSRSAARSAAARRCSAACCSRSSRRTSRRSISRIRSCRATRSLYAIAAELRIDSAGRAQSSRCCGRCRIGCWKPTPPAARSSSSSTRRTRCRPDALEEIRLLSNLESSRHKLLQIVLFGQPELDQRLRENSMRQLNDRITHQLQAGAAGAQGCRRIPDVPAARCRLSRPRICSADGRSS
jgi:hypothetical protein